MALLPGENYIIQQIGGSVVLFESGSEQEIVRFDPSDANAAARAQFTIYSSDDLTAEQKCFAHFWCGYFYAHGGGPGGFTGAISISDVPVLPGEGSTGYVPIKVDTSHFHEHDQDRAEDKTYESRLY